MLLKPTNAASINISDTIASNNARDGVAVVNPGGPVNAFLDRVQAVGNGNGGVLLQSDGGDGTIHAMVTDSLAAHNNVGFGVVGNVSMTLINDGASLNNSYGVFSGSGTMQIANSKVYGNPNGFGVGGTLKTFGNNDFANNGTNIGSLTPIGQQ